MIALESLPTLIDTIRAWEEGRGPITIMVGCCELLRQQNDGQRVSDLDTEAVTKMILDTAINQPRSLNTIVTIQIAGEIVFNNRFGWVYLDYIGLAN